jgi:hypothetical protein
LLRGPALYHDLRSSLSLSTVTLGRARAGEATQAQRCGLRKAHRNNPTRPSEKLLRHNSLRLCRGSLRIMSGSNTPLGGKQEKAMSSRLLTMKVSHLRRRISIADRCTLQFMQRSAASASNQAPSASSPLPANFSRSPQEDSAKRQKLSSIPQSPDPAALTPRSLYQSDDPTTPLPQGMGKAFTQCYGGNEAETPWILNTSRSIGTQEAPRSPLEGTSPPDAVIGRRTFGNFKKKTTENSAADRSKDDDSLSSGFR